MRLFMSGVFLVPQDSYKISPGDSFRTTCYYKDGSAFGLSSQEEMCIAYIMYYPAKQSSSGQPWVCPHKPWYDLGTPGCAQELVKSNLDSADDLGRNFGGSSDECVSKPASNSSPVGKC